MARKAANPTKKTGVSKSQAIRDHMAKHPDDGPNAVSDALKKMGIKVSPAFVSTVKSMDKRRSLQLRHPSEFSDIPMSDLLQAKKLAKAMGGVERARAALDALSQLVH